MTPGEVFETAMWMDGTETPDLIAKYKEDCSNAIGTIGSENNVVMGPIVWSEKRPGDDHVPPVPDHISGPDVRLLVAEAQVVCNAPFIPVAGSFLLELDKVDLERLRAITRKQYGRYNPGGLSDAQCDTVIEEIGPNAAYEAVKRSVDTVH